MPITVLVNKQGLLFGDIGEASKRAIATAGQLGLTFVAEATPVRTGRLKAGWSFVGNELGNSVRYAPFVEAKRTMLASNVPRIESQLAEALQKELNGDG